MTVAAQQLAQHERQIEKAGQWVAIRRYTGTTVKTWTDTPAKAYLQHKPPKEFIGAVVQQYISAVTLANTVGDWHPPVGPRDKLMVWFTGHNDLGTTPPLNEESHVTSGKEFAINSAARRDPGGVLIALEIEAVG